MNYSFDNPTPTPNPIQQPTNNATNCTKNQLKKHFCQIGGNDGGDNDCGENNRFNNNNYNPTQAPNYIPTQAPTNNATQAPNYNPTQAPTNYPLRDPTYFTGCGEANNTYFNNDGGDDGGDDGGNDGDDEATIVTNYNEFQFILKKAIHMKKIHRMCLYMVLKTQYAPMKMYEEQSKLWTEIAKFRLMFGQDVQPPTGKELAGKILDEELVAVNTAMWRVFIHNERVSIHLDHYKCRNSGMYSNILLYF